MWVTLVHSGRGTCLKAITFPPATPRPDVAAGSQGPHFAPESAYWHAWAGTGTMRRYRAARRPAGAHFRIPIPNKKEALRRCCTAPFKTSRGPYICLWRALCQNLRRDALSGLRSGDSKISPAMVETLFLGPRFRSCQLQSDLNKICDIKLIQFSDRPPRSPSLVSLAKK